MKASLTILSIVFIAFILTGFVGKDLPKSHNNLNKVNINFAVIDTIYTTDAKSIEMGETLYNVQCKSCHTLDNDGIGPRLGGITKVVPRLTLIKFVQSPANFLLSEDSRWKLLHQQYKQIMPAFDFLKAKEIENIFAYIHQQSNKLNLKPLELKESKIEKNQVTENIAPKIIQSKYVINLQDFIQLPKAKGNPSDKGIATLRTSPFKDSTFFVSDMIGIIFKVKDMQNAKADTFLNVRKLLPDFISSPGIGTGLGSFAFHPDFIKNGLFYTSHAEDFGKKTADFSYADTLKPGLQWVITEWKMKNPRSKVFEGTHRELLRVNTPTTAHGFQDITFSPVTDKKNPDYGILYIGSGDGGSNNIKRPDLVHNRQTMLGTIIRINPLGNNSKNGQYGVPADNPFIKDSNPKVVKEIYAHGFRNPHRMAWDTANNRMLVADIGEANIEEIDIVKNGGDYGWPQREGKYRIDTRETLRKIYSVTPAEQAIYKLPFAVYDHDEDRHAISGGFVYEGNLKLLQNKYIFGDIVNGNIFFVNMDAGLTDSRVYELAFTINGETADPMNMYGRKKRAQLRICYDDFTKEMYVTNKTGIMRKITSVKLRGEK
jgi:glucose/arabinose dehydrogenase/mono/diheme cytochrome c family protein